MKVLIVDDDSLIVKSLALTLSREPDIEVIGCASNGSEALAICSKLIPDIVLMDIRMPGIDGISATRLLKQRYPGILIMILTTFDDSSSIKRSLVAGADGYLVKTDKITKIAEKLRIMFDGTGVLDTGILKKITVPGDSLRDLLTQRELDIAALVAQGMTNKEIAAQLFLSEGTVRNNIVVIMEKLCVTNRTQLALYVEFRR